MKCYYGMVDCDNNLWQCQMCKEWFCETHWHQTSLGRSVECAACERERLDSAAWKSPNEWMMSKIEGVGKQLFSALVRDAYDFNTEEMSITMQFAREMAKSVDPDVIQDMFQNEMEADGYFEEVENV